MASRIRIKINPKLRSNMYKGLVEGNNATLHYIKQKLRNYNLPVYEDRGLELSRILRQTYLTPEPGMLEMGWKENISNIRIYRGKTTISMNLFNSRSLDKYTPWIGLNEEQTETQSVDRPSGNKVIGINKYKFNGTPIQSDSAVRPLPAIMMMDINGKRSSFVWRPNPYPGSGYWRLFEQGIFGNNVFYEGRFLIRNAYYSILGKDTNLLLSENNARIQLSQDVFNKLKRNVSYFMNKAIK